MYAHPGCNSYILFMCLYSEPSPMHSPSKRSTSNRGRKRKRAKDDSEFEMGQYQRMIGSSVVYGYVVPCVGLIFLKGVMWLVLGLIS